MTLFHDYLEGTFDNRLQAMHYPTRYARIVINHKWIGGDWFEGKQAYLISAAFVVSGLGALVSGIYWKKSERFQAVGGVIIGLGFFALWFAF